MSGHGGGEGGIRAQPPGRRGHFPPDWMKCTSTKIALQHLVILMGRGSGVRATVLGRLLYRLKNESAARELFSYNPTPCPPGPLPAPPISPLPTPFPSPPPPCRRLAVPLALSGLRALCVFAAEPRGEQSGRLAFAPGCVWTSYHCRGKWRGHWRLWVGGGGGGGGGRGGGVPEK